MNNELSYFLALKEIASYDSPEKLARTSEKKYGLSYTEALEMAYENIIDTAKGAVRGKRAPKVPVELQNGGGF